MSKWQQVKLKDICTVTSSKRFHLSERTDIGIPFYCSKEIIKKESGEKITECDFIPTNIYNAIAEKYGVPQPGDILLTTRGSIGVPYLYKSGDCFYFADGNLTWLKNFNKLSLPHFLYYWFKSYIGFGKINAIAKGTAQKAVPIAEIKNIELELPPIEVQRKIADVLSAYDDLIENNRKQIKLLEEAAQRLYKEWFIDLRFPGHETTPIIDGIPAGWRRGSIIDISVCFDGKRIPLSMSERNNQNKIYPYYGAASLMDYVEDYIFDGIYLLFGEDGTVISRDGSPILQYVWGKFWVNNHAHIFQGTSCFSTEFLYMLCKHLNVSDVVTGVAQPKISQGRLNAKKILIPQKNLVLKYTNVTKEMFKAIRLYTDQIILLTETRNRLLPKLMTGELEVE